jgi:hypothetical protein
MYFRMLLQHKKVKYFLKRKTDLGSEFSQVLPGGREGLEEWTYSLLAF